ncbi:hypothetical protein [Pedobacter insulae]|uniref:YtxH-like protein n=1 Tax=Pedobacter insulae TaxID=414048 RepID=A0A1I2XL12_9SPHI|nr:hypothetical protein [Pedobacter insulae]SFH13709.1 hypothetical protein SAMN04489864_105294 [Pedobacter insulae]
MTKQTKILTGLLAGAALGAGIALVLSDKNDMKEKMSDWLCDVLSQSKGSLGKVSGLLKDALAKTSSAT